MPPIPAHSIQHEEDVDEDDTMKPEGVVDDDVIDNLARLTSQGLSMGPSIVDKIGDSFVMLPSKLLHPGLYDCSLRDISMVTAAAATKTPPTLHSYSDRNGGREGGVPGFPDFPDFWTGDVSSAYRHDNVRGGFKQNATKNQKSSPLISRRDQTSQQLQRSRRE